MSNHLTEIEIKNFKCFKDFKADGFKRVNLIGGKNNVGKTAFMEACFVNSLVENKCTFFSVIVRLITLEKLRNKKDNQNKVSNIILLLKKFNKLSLKSNLNQCNLKLEEENLKTKFYFNDKEEPLDFNQNDTLIIAPAINFIPSYMIDDNLINTLYDEIRTQRKKEELNQILNQFDKNILEFEVIANMAKVFLSDLNDFQNISESGHGLKRYIAIITSILVNKDNILYIDEIENGIHYSNFDKLWEIVLKTSNKQNVQVFATTHSKECIESFARVSEELKDEDISFISLYKDRENNIKAVTLNNQEIKDRIELGLDNR